MNAVQGRRTTRIPHGGAGREPLIVYLQQPAANQKATNQPQPVGFIFLPYEQASISRGILRRSGVETQQVLARLLWSCRLRQASTRQPSTVAASSVQC